MTTVSTDTTSLSNTLLFWIAFVLTRPFGANAGDFFSKPTALGGRGYGPLGSSLILATVLAALIVHAQVRQSKRSPADEEENRRSSTVG